LHRSMPKKYPAEGDFRRIVVIGNTGSGKTTLARALAALLGAPHVELDALHWWEPNWVLPRVDDFRARAAAALAGPAWVADGNYRAIRDIAWGRADTIIWLNYSLWVNLWRLLRRSLRRSFIQPELWNGNRECFRQQFLSADSLFVWAVKTHRRRRKQIPAALAQPEYAHLRVLQFCTPAATRRWLREAQKRAGNGNRTRAFSLGS
jgi:adenylate kinase family enzyme